MKIAIETLGCKVNQYESASIERILRENGFEIVDRTANPDICIINTCTVTGKSDYQSRQLIRKAVRSGARVIATGCYAQLRSDELSRIRGVDLVVGNTEKMNILSSVNMLGNNTVNFPKAGDRHSTAIPATDIFERSRATLKIQDGCNFSCSYCTVPLARGKSRSVSVDEVIQSASMLASCGYREIVLTGIHIGSYGLDLSPQSTLLKIVEKLVVSYPDIRFRLSSLEPVEFREEFLDLIASGNVCRHLHLPLQSGSDRILGRMNRGYSTGFFRQTIEKIVSSVPGITVGTDVIVGFPGETDEEFAQTVNFIEELPVSYLHVFPYSVRPHTKAAEFTDQVKEQVKKERVRKLIAISKKKRRSFYKQAMGKVLDVIVESKDTETGMYRGISDNYIKVLIKSGALQRGERIRAKVISMTPSSVLAEPYSEGF